MNIKKTILLLLYMHTHIKVFLGEDREPRKPTCYKAVSPLHLSPQSNRASTKNTPEKKIVLGGKNSAFCAAAGLIKKTQQEEQKPGNK